MRPPSVAVVVPLSHRPALLPDEEISLRHLRHYLGAYDRFVVVPQSRTIRWPDFEVVRFDDRYFGSVRAHTALMLSPRFYRAFARYDFILTYHLDALVLSDQVAQWCRQPWDFIGAPNRGFTMPCNGGFALRRVASFLAVLESQRYGVDPDRYWRAIAARTPRPLRPFRRPAALLKRLHRFNNVTREIRLLLRHPAEPLEDVFIVENAAKYHPPFRIPPVPEALRFAFDEAPRTAFEMNGRRLPFGAHRWYRLDRAFWEPYLLR